MSTKSIKATTSEMLCTIPAQPDEPVARTLREQWEGGDVVWLGLHLDDQLDGVALAERNDVILKELEVAVEGDGDSEISVLASGSRSAASD